VQDVGGVPDGHQRGDRPTGPANDFSNKAISPTDRPTQIAASQVLRQTLLGIAAADPALAASRPGQTLIADRQYYGTAFEAAGPSPSRILALTSVIWHNDHTSAPVHRSLTAYDH